jgi:hypothetical protein
VNRELPEPLPETMPDGRFLALDDHWKPYSMGGYRMLLDTLRPYLSRNGIDRRDFSFTYRIIYNSWAVQVLLAVILLAAAFAAAVILFG